MGGKSKAEDAAPAAATRRGDYEEDAIYQGGKVVARVVGANIRQESREVWFAEINSSDNLILPEECEFHNYRLMIQRIEYASRIDRQTPEKGRILRGVIAEVLGILSS